ncbi:hypothetical protein C7M84_009808 [Penaeus vannamei]|uniref:Uncharacterized protein n=1 Tax=Penaeus vannamei TaxID=6689 RepID=A0A3R7SRH4_PENVA|nr:uncharacterized protein LOC113811638 [Penaeus vannamei]ROT71837.1 hypothetical protein C7M84_009808 [Penaeus vannamei]
MFTGNVLSQFFLATAFSAAPPSGPDAPRGRGGVPFDFLSYGYASYTGDAAGHTSYGRSLVTTAAKVWDQRDQLGLNPYVRGGRGLDSMTQILDDIADAILKYEGLEDNVVGQSRQSKVLQQ